MRLSSLELLFYLLVCALTVSVSPVWAFTNAGVFDGRPYLWLEAEDFTSSDNEGGTGWTVVSRESPITSTQGLDILPAGSNVSGTALLDLAGGAQHVTTQYTVNFPTAGTYQLYSRHSMFDNDGNGNYGNEDSIYVSPAFNLNSETDWEGFEGLRFDDQAPGVEIPVPGEALDPAGFFAATGDSPNDGWYAIRDWGVKSAGVVTFPNDATADDWNGNFNWYNRPALVSTGPGGGFDSDFGFKTEYLVTEDQVNQDLTFEIGTREPYGVFDGFLFLLTTDLAFAHRWFDSESPSGMVSAALPSGVVVSSNG